MSTVLFSLGEARDLAAEAFTRSNTRADIAQTVAAALVAAEADGLKGHGLSRVPSYAAQARVGKIDGFADPTAERVKPGALKVDAAHGFAYPALDLTLREIAPLARSQGVALAGVIRSSHCGVAGHWVERLARDGLVALLFANTPAAIAPWGGSKALFGTNPIAFACPVAGGDPVVIDLSLSKVARGNIMAAKQRGEPIPEGWALDAEGRPTTDATAALGGTMLPFGDAKGATLAFMVELLAASLVGATIGPDASSFLDANGPPPGTGQLLIAIDANGFGDGPARFATLAGLVAANGDARVPGARRIALRNKAAQAGLMLPAALVDEIRRL